MNKLMSKKKSHSNRIATINDLISSKMDLSTIKESRLNTQAEFHQYPTYDFPLQLVRGLYQDQSKLVNHRLLKKNNPVHVQLIPQNEEYFYVPMSEVIFPVYLQIQNLKNSGRIYVGYDREFPGIQLAHHETYLHDFKFQIAENQQITLKNPKRKNVRMLFLTVQSEKTMFSLDLSVSFTFEEMAESPSKYKKFFGHKFVIPPMHRNLSEKKFRIQTEMATKNNSSLVSLKKGALESKTITKSRLLSPYKKARIFEEQIKMKICSQDRSKQKKIELRNKANKTKEVIEGEKQAIEMDILKRKKLNYYLLCMIMGSIFCSKSQFLYQSRRRYLQQTYKINNIMLKFIRSIRKEMTRTSFMIPSFKTRNKVSLHMFLTYQAKIQHSTFKQNSLTGIINIFQEIKPALICNELLKACDTYRETIMKLQKRWAMRVKARSYILKYVSRRHIAGMLKKAPYFKMFEEAFQPLMKKFIKEYMVDETKKYHKLYKLYLAKLKQIEDFKEKNEEMKKKKGKKELKLLRVPDVPIRPEIRYYRNLDSLRMAIRGWFEIEYKKFMKLNAI